ncbi:unknown [Bacteroides sp. CAG:661]|nr:unknown [Bacteroides sp. CAG:661]
MRLKLMPVENMAMISEFSASFEVKKMTAMNTNSGLNRLAK